jgi:phosphoglycerate dehydrogenase-like enzyme
LKNLLIFEASLERLKSRFASYDGLNLLAFTNQGTIRNGDTEVKGEAMFDLPIHASWLSFEGPRELLPTFCSLQVKSQALEFVQTASAGLDNVFFKQLASKPIQLCNSDAQALSIAEYVVSSLLFRLQRIDQRIALQHNKDWQEFVFRELAECHCLVLGYGNIGSRIADRLRAFESKVSVIRRNTTDIDGIAKTGTISDLPNMLGDVDVVIAAAALNDDTDQLFDQAMFQRFKPGTIFINIARGSMVDETALSEALDNGQVSYAVLDVFQQEPLPADHRFWLDDRILISAHASNAGSGRQQRGDELFFENLDNYLNSTAMRNLVDLDTI